MPYFSNAPGPTPCEELPQPLSVMEQIKNISDASRNTKRKLSEETSGKNDFGGFIFNLLSFLILFFQTLRSQKKAQLLECRVFIFILYFLMNLNFQSFILSYYLLYECKNDENKLSNN